MLLAITKKELERIESLMLPIINRKVSENKTGLFVLKVFSFSFLGILIVLLCSNISLIVSSILSFLISGIVACIAAWSIFPLKVKPTEIPAKNIKEAMIDRLKSFYLPNNNIEFLKTLYERSLLKRDQKEQIAQFLTINGKTIVDYLNSLGDKNLEMLAQPYRDQINKDINEAVESYFIGKRKELELQIIAENSKKSDEERFKEDCLNFFYSTMPKNIATQGDKLCC